MGPSWATFLTQDRQYPIIRLKSPDKTPMYTPQKPGSRDSEMNRAFFILSRISQYSRSLLGHNHHKVRPWQHEEFLHLPWQTLSSQVAETIFNVIIIIILILIVCAPWEQEFLFCSLMHFNPSKIVPGTQYVLYNLQWTLNNHYQCYAKTACLLLCKHYAKDFIVIILTIWGNWVTAASVGTECHKLT